MSFELFRQSTGNCADAANRARLCVVLLDQLFLLIIFCSLIFPLPGCGTASSNPSTPSIVVVSIQPTSASPILSQTQQFQATVVGAANTSVTWEVNGVTGGSAAEGTISTGGLYTAPAVMPSPPTVMVEAVSGADPQASALASLTLTDDIAVSVAPNPANVTAGGAQVFTANVTGTGNA